MNKLTLLLVLFPFTLLAQKASQDSKVILKSYTLHFEKNMVVSHTIPDKNKPGKSEMKVEGPGEMEFGKDTMITARQRIQQENTTPDWEYAGATADKVTIKCPSYPDLKGDKFIYDHKTDKAMLTCHITIVDHGVEKQIGETIYLDFSDNVYKILSFK